MVGEIELTYQTEWGTYFWIDGDIILERRLSVKGSESYVLGWIREKLRKMENGQMKVVKGRESKDSLERKRDWEQEEKIRKRLWTNEEEIRTGKTISRELRIEHVCPTGNAQVMYHRELSPPPSSSCKIS